MRTRHPLHFASAFSLLSTLLLAPAAVAHDWNGLVRDSKGRLFVVDAEDGYVWKVAPDGKARGFVTGATAESMIHPHHLAIDGEDRLWLASGCDKNLLWTVAPDGTVAAADWPPKISNSADAAGTRGVPEGFVLETVAPDGDGGMWFVSSRQTLWRARDGAPRLIAEIGSLAGALAIGSDGALLLGDGAKLWRIARPRTDAKSARVAPELLADGLGDLFGIAIGGDGTLFVADWEGGRILAIESGKPRVVASGMKHPSGIVALPDGTLVVKESGRQENGTPRLSLVDRQGKITPWVELQRDRAP